MSSEQADIELSNRYVINDEQSILTQDIKHHSMHKETKSHYGMGYELRLERAKQQLEPKRLNKIYNFKRPERNSRPERAQRPERPGRFRR